MIWKLMTVWCPRQIHISNDYKRLISFKIVLLISIHCICYCCGRAIAFPNHQHVAINFMLYHNRHLLSTSFLLNVYLLSISVLFWFEYSTGPKKSHFTWRDSLVYLALVQQCHHINIYFDCFCDYWIFN